MIDFFDIETNLSNNELFEEYLNNHKEETYLLDTSKNDNYSYIEYFVSNTCKYHFNRLNLIFDENYYIEFWIKSKDYNSIFHFDCDESKRNNENKYFYPILSCVSYFSDSLIPFILTNINYDDIKYKNINKKHFYMNFPKKFKQICFNSTFFHGTSNPLNIDYIDKDRYIIAINVWKDKPENVKYFNNMKLNYQLEKKNININHIDKPNIDIIKSDLINFDFFEELIIIGQDCSITEEVIDDLHKSFFNIFNIFKDLISEKHIKNGIIKFIYKDDNIDELEKIINEKTKIILNDYNEIIDNKLICKNRFIQRFLFNKYYNDNICKWIINEAESYANNNGGWTTERHKSYPTTDIPIHLIKNIFNYLLHSFQDITCKIKDSYNLDTSCVIDFDDVFIVKYDENKQNFLQLHQDGSILSFQILLSDNSDFEGGGTYFDDGLLYKLNIGDLFIHSGRSYHSGLPIYNGIRYLLVGFVNIII